MKNMTVSAIAKACGGQVVGLPEEQKQIEAAGVVLDSRQVEKDYIFIATKGEKVDGHSFIPQVMEKGALACVCETLPDPVTGPCILVEDSFAALRAIAKYYREQLDITMIGITGSVGKTSTKEFVAGVLGKSFSVLKTEKNYNNEVGVPLTLLKIREEHQVAVLEMGINHFGEMHRLSEMVQPDYCIFTNIGPCHLEHLGDLNGVLRAKSEIFDFQKKDGKIFVNGDDDKLVTLKEKKKGQLITYGCKGNNDIYSKDLSIEGLQGSTFSVEGMVSMPQVRIPLPGEHMVYNALVAIAVAHSLGMKEEDIAKGLASVEGVGGRSHVISFTDYTVIDDCYNANPVSMRAALDLLATAKTRKVAILGDMFELGENERMLHSLIGTYAMDRVDVLIAIGELSKEMADAAKEHCYNQEVYYFPTKDVAMQTLFQLLKPQDTILLKASHGMEFTSILAAFA